jgi:hypothetical protein
MVRNPGSLVGLALVLLAAPALGKLTPEEVPTFRVRVRVVSVQGQPPAAE